MSQHKWEPPISQGEARLREWEDAKGFLTVLGYGAMILVSAVVFVGCVGYFLFSVFA